MEIQHRRRMGRGITSRELGGCAPFLHQQVKDDFLESKTGKPYQPGQCPMHGCWTHTPAFQRERTENIKTLLLLFLTLEKPATSNIQQTLQALKCVLMKVGFVFQDRTNNGVKFPRKGNNLRNIHIPLLH